MVSLENQKGEKYSCSACSQENIVSTRASVVDKQYLPVFIVGNLFKELS